MSERTKYPEWIDRFNSGEMTPEEKDHFLELIRTNEKLRLEVELDRQINEMLADEDLADLRKKMDQIKKSSSRIQRKYLLLAASLVILLSTGIFLLVESIRGDKSLTGNFQRSSQNESIAQAKDFIPNKKYEILLDMFTRSANFELILPKKEAEYELNQNIIFQWKTTSPKKITIRIINSAGEEILSLQTSEGHALFPAENLPMGLFYYKVIQGNTLVKIGKLVIR